MSRILIMGLILVFVYVYVHRDDDNKPVLVSAHVINMEESNKRLAEFQENAATAGIAVTRWPAIDSRNMTEEDLAPQKLSKYIWKWAMDNKKMGMLGCYLSHRGLLTHLEKMPVDPNSAHLVLEDDAYLPADFQVQWAAVLEDASRVAPDWEILQLGVTFPNIRKISGKIHRHVENRGNGGTFAYAVRHRALKKINAHIEYMTDPIDIMLRNKWREWKYYIVWPEVCPHNDHGNSIIVSNA